MNLLLLAARTVYDPLVLFGFVLWGGPFMLLGLLFVRAHWEYLRQYRNVHGTQFDIPGDPLRQVRNPITRLSGGLLWPNQWRWWEYLWQPQRALDLERTRRKALRLQYFAVAWMVVGIVFPLLFSQL